MGLNHISIAAVIALLGTATALQAETVSPPAEAAANAPAIEPAPLTDPALQASPIAQTPTDQPAAPAPTDEPALKASPIVGSEPATPPVPAPETASPTETKGDVLTMPKKAPAAKKKKAVSTPIRIEEDGMPGRGASMAQVEKHFGAPLEKRAPVGNPPITRWIYSNYTVYFEYEYVIHSVRNDGRMAPEQPAPAAEAAPAPAASGPAPMQ